jgi:hypothetical protein
MCDRRDLARTQRLTGCCDLNCHRPEYVVVGTPRRGVRVPLDGAFGERALSRGRPSAGQAQGLPLQTDNCMALAGHRHVHVVHSRDC